MHNAVSILVNQYLNNKENYIKIGLEWFRKLPRELEKNRNLFANNLIKQQHYGINDLD